MTELTGGFNNQVLLRNGIVEKHFSTDHSIGQDSLSRLRRERMALTRFGGTIAPHFLGQEGGVMKQEYIHGESAEKLIANGEAPRVFEDAGRLLRQIHAPVNRHPQYLQEAFFHRIAKTIPTAQPILDEEHLDVQFDIDWNQVYALGTTRVHRDFWFVNVIQNGGPPVAIDWEFAGVGSPYEDFAVVDFSVFGPHGGRDHFWRGYGSQPDQQTTDQFVKAKCLEWLGAIDLEYYKTQDTSGFYHHITDVLRTYESTK